MTDNGADTAPLQEIGEVMFADFFRQSCAGVRVQALPFFQRRVIRQRDGIMELQIAKRSGDLFLRLDLWECLKGRSRPKTTAF